MIQTLRKKFILTAMLAISILILSLLGTINGVNSYLSAKQNREWVENLIRSETTLPYPKPNKMPEPEKMFEVPFGRVKERDFRHVVNYFSIKVDSTGEVTNIDRTRSNTLTEEDALGIYKEAMQKNKLQGKIQGFYYDRGVNETDGSKVYIFLDTSLQIQSMWRILFLSLFLGGLCWLVMLLLVFLLSKKAIEPIAENIERQKQFVTDAGHEIKTPLAIILSNTEAMELYKGENKWSKNIKEQVAHLSDLTENLLALAKADEKGLDFPKEDVLLSAVVVNGLARFSETMTLKKIHLSKKIDMDVWAWGNEPFLQRLFSILLENAIKYTQENGEISVKLFVTHKYSILEITNTCVALPTCMPHKLFDRFYRGNTARTQKTGGFGIGLSAARSIVEIHGGKIESEYKDETHIVFRVKLPIT
jgi:hypothetical protein